MSGAIKVGGFLLLLVVVFVLAYALGTHGVVGNDPSLCEVGSVSGKAASDRHAFRDAARETSRQVGAVDVQAVRKHEHMAQRGVVQQLCKFFADVIARLRLTNRRRGGAQSRMLEFDKSGSHRVVHDRVAENLAGRRAAKHRGAFEVVAQLAHGITCPHQ